jgi:MFS family permease
MASVGTAFAIPIMSALLPLILGAGQETSAGSWNSAATQTGYLVGYGVGGVLVGTFGTGAALFTDSLSYGFSAVAFLCVTIRRIPPVIDREATSSQPDGSYSLLWQHRNIRIAVTNFAIVMLFGVMINVADVFFVITVLGAGPATFGMVTALWPLAGIAAAWGVSRVPVERLPTVAALAALAMGSALVGAAWSAALPVLVVAWIIGGAANAAQRVSVFALLYHHSHDEARGRLLAATSGILQGTHAAGLVAGTLAVTLFGARLTILGAGLIIVALALTRLGPLLHVAIRVRTPAYREPGTASSK